MVCFVGIFAFVLILTNAHARHTHSSSHDLRHLLNPRSSDYQSPIIVIVDTRGQSSDQSDSQSASDEKRDEADDEETYRLYNQLRSHPEDDLSSGEVAKLEETKHVLRAALVSRCRKMDRCARSCPKVKKYTCVVTCQMKYDSENACDEPVEEPKCGKTEENNCNKKQKWGKTMPPSWFIF